MKVNKAVYGYVSETAPKEKRLEALRAPLLLLKPSEKLTAIYVLTHDKDEEVRAAAKKAFLEFPESMLIAALEEGLDPLIIKKIAQTHPSGEKILIKAALNRAADEKTLEDIVKTAPVAVLEEIFKNRESITSPVLKALKENPNAPAIGAEDIAESEEKPAVKKHTPQTGPPFPGPGEEEHLSIQQRLMQMTVTEKIKLALLGNKEAREVLIRDSNKIVSITVLHNPHITDEEIMKIAASTGTPDELIREVTRKKEWLKNYQIKKNVVSNPKTPLKAALRLIGELNDKDLEKLAKSRNIQPILASTARKILQSVKKR